MVNNNKFQYILYRTSLQNKHYITL